jgi:hypothetical protein
MWESASSSASVKEVVTVRYRVLCQSRQPLNSLNKPPSVLQRQIILLANNASLAQRKIGVAVCDPYSRARNLVELRYVIQWSAASS